MRGYFAVGAERISKPHNVGALVRTAHAFGASFLFAVDPFTDVQAMDATDTSAASGAVPFYTYPDIAGLMLPKGCRLVGIELIDGAIALPSFRHPLQAAYLLGPERGSLSPEALDRCDHVVQIPTRFCVNLSVAGAIVLYDRMVSLGRFAERPVRTGGPTSDLPPHVRGGPISRSGAGRAVRSAGTD